MDDELKKKLTNQNLWLRAVYVLLFYLIYYCTEFIVGVIALIQFGLCLFSGDANDNLKNLGRRLATYNKEIVEFLTFNTEAKPYPFSAWPSDYELVVKLGGEDKKS